MYAGSGEGGRVSEMTFRSMLRYNDKKSIDFIDNVLQRQMSLQASVTR